MASNGQLQQRIRSKSSAYIHMAPVRNPLASTKTPRSPERAVNRPIKSCCDGADDSGQKRHSYCAGRPLPFTALSYNQVSIASLLLDTSQSTHSSRHPTSVRTWPNLPASFLHNSTMLLTKMLLQIITALQSLERMLTVCMRAEGSAFVGVDRIGMSQQTIRTGKALVASGLIAVVILLEHCFVVSP